MGPWLVWNRSSETNSAFHWLNFWGTLCSLVLLWVSRLVSVRQYTARLRSTRTVGIFPPQPLALGIFHTLPSLLFHLLLLLFALLLLQWKLDLQKVGNQKMCIVMVGFQALASMSVSLFCNFNHYFETSFSMVYGMERWLVIKASPFVSGWT